ncbi:sugar ABC transporter ATP-binding protein [Falsirhodobacter sp. 20TX0035]|uniref:sugar ABC transporter ATP-binding protein n=1 Tax=Falsirhodobacter sp. 20TX0035 TaxID=3022019 RepID=UPI00232AE8CD|nr:sugar ABC transporter ATP-binding protein [Falsirhodobacter sp. 20TX0035]MDB6454081.1 sugar ABC transporter ATP-binding protein [Falsirhodobacter sp. 20TX0035]
MAEGTRTVLDMRGIEKRFGDVKALDNVGFNLIAGEIHALLGVNGAGKSTLIKILSGVYTKDEGRIEIGGEAFDLGSPRAAIEAGIAVVQQHPELVGDLSGAENIYLGHEGTRPGLFARIDRSDLAARAEALLARFPIDVDLSRRVADMPAVDREIVAILHALRLENARILILDEPTSTLTEREKASLFAMMRMLKAAGIAIIYITHRLEEVYEIADRFTVFRGGRNVACHTVAEAQATGLSIPNLMLGTGGGLAFPPRATTPAGAPVLAVDGLSCDGMFRDVSFTACKGEILGIFGLVGSGVDELSKALFGVFRPDRGQIRLHGKPVTLRSPAQALRSGIFLVPGDRRTEGLTLDENVIFNTTVANLGRASFGGLLRFGANRRHTRALAEKVDLQPMRLDRTLRGFSGGNQQKVVIAKGLYRQAQAYIFVEPTVGVDIGARTKIYALMREIARDAAVIVISSDCDEVHGVADRTLALYKGAPVGSASRDTSRDHLLHAGIMGGIAA